MKISKKMSVPENGNSSVSVRVCPCSSVFPKIILTIAIFAICGVRSFAAETLKEKAIKLGFDKIVFCTRAPGAGSVMAHWYDNVGHDMGGKFQLCGGKGGWLYSLSLKNGKLTTIMEDDKGDIRDPFVHHSGEKILFSYMKGGTKQFHLCEINPDGTGFRQITNDSYYDDIEPIYLPNDDIVFTSTRSKHYAPCWSTQATTLYRCGPNGENVTAISANTSIGNHPWLLNDGRIILMQWDYVNRSHMGHHHLYTVNPDGTGRKVFFGSMIGTGLFIDAKPIPNSTKIVFILSPGHGGQEHAGWPVVFDPSLGPDNGGQRVKTTAEKMKIIKDFHPKVMSPVVKKTTQKYNDIIKKYKKQMCGSKGLKFFYQFRDPYPLSDDLFLLATGDRIILMDINGKQEIIYEIEEGNDFAEQLGDFGNNYFNIWAHEPRPLRKRKPKPIIPSVVNPNNKMGTMILANVYQGRNMIGVKKGEIKKLLIYEDLPKPIGTGMSFSIMGSYFLHRVLGEVPVEDDGSAYFEVPANSALWFVALDKDDKAVKWMQSFVNLMPGETRSCVGCHENRTETYNSTTLKALSRPVSKISKIEGVLDISNYHDDIQPIWNKHCVSCHNSKKRAGKVELTGDLGHNTNISFESLIAEEAIIDGYDSYGNRNARSMGTGASTLMNKIDGSHHNVKLSKIELNKVRVWLDSGYTYPGTLAYMDGLHAGRITISPMLDFAKKHCSKCHQRKGNSYFKRYAASSKSKNDVVIKKDFYRDKRTAGSSKIRYSLGLINLTNVKDSVLLRKPLTQTAGGLAEKENHPVIFKSCDATGYKELLKIIQKMSDARNEGGRPDTKNYIPGLHYVREMKAYGILPKCPSKNNLDFHLNINLN